MEAKKKMSEIKLGNKLPNLNSDENKTTAKVADMFNTNRTYVSDAGKIKEDKPE